MARNVLHINGPVRLTPRRIDECYCERECIHCSSPTLECTCQTGIDYGGEVGRLISLVQCTLQKFIIQHCKTVDRHSRYNSYNMLVHSDVSKCPWHE